MYCIQLCHFLYNKLNYYLLLKISVLISLEQNMIPKGYQNHLMNTSNFMEKIIKSNNFQLSNSCKF